MSELKVNPNYKLDKTRGEFKASNGIEFSHLAIDTCDDKLFFKTQLFLDEDKKRLRLQIETDDSTIVKWLEFELEIGREIGEAILDLCKEGEPE